MLDFKTTCPSHQDCKLAHGRAHHMNVGLAQHQHHQDQDEQGDQKSLHDGSTAKYARAHVRQECRSHAAQLDGT